MGATVQVFQSRLPAPLSPFAGQIISVMLEDTRLVAALGPPHMILNHDLKVSSEELATAFLPDLGDDVLRALGRSSYTDDAELTAEALADQLVTRIINSEVGSLPEPLAFRRVVG